MEGRDFGPPPPLLTERGPLAHRVASRITAAGHAAVQHPAAFQPGKFYPSHIPIPSQSGTGLMANSSASFMGTFLASSLGSPPSHPSGPPSSPSSPPYRSGPHSSAHSQIWFPHPHEAPGYSRFSGSLAPTFLPMSPLDHHGNSSVLYGQHRFYNTSKDFYIRSLSSQPHLLSTNHTLQSLTRTTPSHPLSSCSRERDPGGGGQIHKSSKESDVGEPAIAVVGKDREKSKLEVKDRQRHDPPSPTAHQHLHPHHHSQLHPLGPEENPKHKDDPKHLSTCLLSTKNHNGPHTGTAVRGSSLPSCVGPGALSLGTGPKGGGGNICCKEVSGEMRISEPPSDCLRHSAMLGHTHPVPYAMPPHLGLGSAVGGSWPHPIHPHHHHHHHPHPDIYCSPAPLTMSSAQDKSLTPGAGRDHKFIGPTFVPSVGPLGDKSSGPFQLVNSHCRGLRGIVDEAGGEGIGKAKASEKSSNGGRIAHPTISSLPTPSTCHKKSSHQQQQDVYSKVDKDPDWSLGPHSHLPQQAQHGHDHQPHSNLPNHSYSSEAAENSSETDVYQPSLPQGAKDSCQSKSRSYASTPPFRDCSHLGSPHRIISENKPNNESGCTLQRDSQRIARVHHHQQNSKTGIQGQDPDLGPSSSFRDRRKQDVDIAAQVYSGHQAGSSWEMRGQQSQPDNEKCKAYDCFGTGEQGAHPTFTAHQQSSIGPHGPENSAMNNLMKYSNHQPHLPAQKSPFGGLGSLKQGAANGEKIDRSEKNRGGAICAHQEGKQTLPSRRASSSGENERSERAGRDSCEGEGEVRQPPVGIAVAVARQREPLRRPPDRPATHSRHGRVLPSMKGIGRSVYPVEREVDEERKSISEEQLSLPLLDRERDLLLRENKDLVEFARIHPSSSCHGDLTSHLIMPSGSQLGADPSVHPTHHWMPRTGSPSLWIGHSYGLSHAALHQNLPPGFSAAMPSPLQPVLPLPQDPSPALVVLPTEPAAHPATHHLDVMEQQGLWPSVYGARGPASHIQHSSVYSRQFLRQQELYMLQHHQHQQHHRAAQAMELAHRQSHSQRKPEDTPNELDEGPPEPRTLKSAKPFSYSSTSKSRSSSSPGGCASRLSPCCHSPAPRPHPKSTLCTPCPEPSPAVAAPCSPALSPHVTPHLPKEAESQDKRGEGQPLQDYPHSLEPDLPPGYTYPDIAIGYKASPSPQEVQLAEHADLEAEQAEPAEPAPQPLSLSTMGEEPVCQEAESPTSTAQVGPQVEDVQVENRLMAEKEELDEEQKGITCTSTSPSSPVCQHLSKFPCQDASPLEEVQMEVSNALTPDQPGFLEVLDPVKEVKTQEEDIVNYVQDPPAASSELYSVMQTEDIKERTKKICTSPSTFTEQEVTHPLSPSSHCSELPALGNQYPGSCIWSLELLIAAAFCATRDAQMAAPVAVPACIAPPQNGMALLSELAELERKQQEKNSNMENAGKERLLIDLESLATLATARALEVTPPNTTESFPPLRRTLNMRRKWKWTPQHEPACPVKSIMETLDREELAMRVQLAELQRRYKEKQKELTKLQRKHDHQKEDTSRSPVRRGPGRPRKRKPTAGSTTPTDTVKRVKLVGAASSLLAAEEELAGGGEKHTKRKKMANSSFYHVSGTQAPCRQRGRPKLLSSKMSQLKQQASAKRDSRLENIFCQIEKPASGSSAEQRHRNLIGRQSETGNTETTLHQNLDGQRIMIQRGCRSKISHGHASSTLYTRSQQMMPNKVLTNSKQEVTGKDNSSFDSELSEPEEEDDGIYDIEELPEDIKNGSSKSLQSGACAPPSSTVQLSIGQNSKCNKKRQGFGSVTALLAKGEMKHRKRAPSRPSLLSEDRNCLLVKKRLNALRWRGVSQESSLHRNKDLKSFPTPLERTARKSSVAFEKRRSCLLGTVSSQIENINWNRKLKIKQNAKRRGMRQLLETFAAEEGFRMDDDSSFSEGEEELEEEEKHKIIVPALPNCVLTKDALQDGLKVLISKEDELLYAAYVHTLDLPDIYSIVIEGERGNRPRIYSLEQLLQEAVLDVQLETVDLLTDGTRVCAYWSERSRCLYPGYVRRGGPGDEQKEGSVMVEFDDGDRGWISLPNIRLLPPGYQIYCAEPSPALLASPTRRRRKSSTQEKSSQQIDISCEWHGNTEPGKTIKAKPGRPKSVSLSTKCGVSENVTGSASSLLTWPSVTMSRKRPSLDLFHFNGLSRKTAKEKETDTFPLLGSTMGTPAKGIFSTSFEVDSFSSIANGFTTFGNQQPTSGLHLGQKSTSNVRGRKTGDRKEYLIKLDHEGVTSPKTKNGKALMLLGNGEFESRGGRMEKGSRNKNVVETTTHMDCSQSVLLMKDDKRSSSHLLKNSSDMRKHSQGLGLGEYPDYVLNCHSDCLSSYSDMDEDEEDEEDSRRTAMRNPRRFLSHLSISSSSSGSSSSSCSGSLSSSSACSSDNDSSYSSDEEEASRLLLQGCLSSHHAVLQKQQQQHPEPTTTPPQHSFIAKAMGVTSTKSMVSNGTGKHQRRKEIPSNSLSTAQTKSSKDCPKKQKTDSPPNSSAFVPARQLWRWSGNPTQRRGLKGKARKLFYKAIVRGKDIIRVGDCAVFLSSGRPHLPYIGRIESLWESWASNMVVKVKWFYHPEETKLGKRHRDGKHALYQSCHEDENDVQTISHKCQVVSRAEYEHLSCLRKPSNNSQDLYYLAGTYDPTSGQLVTAEGVSIIC
ncbi:BAH and coiled-coil domain-containing protein 1 isoform X1 [Silurus meridionalis]|nr:BAH and coiled-coil domain-containing protein 1 isoform X1 [Silurus meridionalis]XP_046710478.1 BAH and coiled-coil domain-containing protein 1 isoform X1 [Silurus meridionalis]XP_046710479.1 BAH and coiled-coil domain-containing protein 1 isoform X1 [Silurus meridionalis]XP_046710480.1 BAH and coiled-coil domain-containing protein 1 isoform X1 [Silurus meridionalis]XP_046710481.1 BAH and coiled-coil domain-containing protein 1 isoform X1 [Silurus meridionalis]XP_046710482.1 BAH and coiled-